MVEALAFRLRGLDVCCLGLKLLRSGFGFNGIDGLWKYGSSHKNQRPFYDPQTVSVYRTPTNKDSRSIETAVFLLVRVSLHEAAQSGKQLHLKR